MTDRQTHSMRPHWISGVPAAMILVLAFCAAARGQEQKTLDAEDLADGMRLYQQKGNCQACHGWAGDGTQDG